MTNPHKSEAEPVNGTKSGDPETPAADLSELRAQVESLTATQKEVSAGVSRINELLRKRAAGIGEDDVLQQHVISAIQSDVEKTIFERPLLRRLERFLQLAIGGGIVVWFGGAIYNGVQVSSVRARANEAINAISLSDGRVREAIAAVDTNAASAQDFIEVARDSAVSLIGVVTADAHTLIADTTAVVGSIAEAALIRIGALEAAAVARIEERRDSILNRLGVGVVDIETGVRTVAELDLLLAAMQGSQDDFAGAVRNVTRTSVRSLWIAFVVLALVNGGALFRFARRLPRASTK
jgi:hypothetical protein